MYGALWRLLPGPTWLRALIVLAIAAALFVLLMEVVFPWAEEFVPWTDVSVGE